MPPTERWDDASATVLPPPHAVALRAEQRLAETPHRAALRDVRCAFRSGVLVLRGQVPSYFLKQVAQSAMTGLEGVQRVVNRIDVTTA
jgi:osmotically-inducible protein OsmY